MVRIDWDSSFSSDHHSVESIIYFTSLPTSEELGKACKLKKLFHDNLAVPGVSCLPPSGRHFENAIDCRYVDGL